MENVALSNRLERSPAELPPSGPAVTRAQRLSELGVRLSRTVALARGLVQGGRRLDLTGVDDGIGVLCAQTLDMAPEEARAMLPMLCDLLAQVDSLSLVLRSAASAPSPDWPC